MSRAVNGMEMSRVSKLTKAFNSGKLDEIRPPSPSASPVQSPKPSRSKHKILQSKSFQSKKNSQIKRPARPAPEPPGFRRKRLPSAPPALGGRRERSNSTFYLVNEEIPPGRRTALNNQAKQQNSTKTPPMTNDANTTPEFLRIKLRSTNNLSSRQSFTTDDIDEIKRLSKESPTPPARRKKHGEKGGSTPSSGQSSPKTGHLSKRKSYTTDDIDLLNGSVSGSKDETVKKAPKPRAPPKPKIPRFGRRSKTPERDRNHHVQDTSDKKSAFKHSKSEQKPDSPGEDVSKPRSKSLTHTKNLLTKTDKAHSGSLKRTCDIEKTCDSQQNGAAKASCATLASFDSYDSREHVYDDVYVGPVSDGDDDVEDDTLKRKKSMNLLKAWSLDFKFPRGDDDNEVMAQRVDTDGAGTLKVDDSGANGEDTGEFSTHECSSFDSDSFDEDYESSESDTCDLSIVCQNTSAMQQVLQDMSDDSANMTPLHRKAHELLVTEREYVKKLKLIDQTFQFRIEMENKKEKMFPEEVVYQMFANIKSIFQFHNDHLLPNLEERMQNWESNQKIGDILCQFAPFLKMYSEYVKNYDTGTTLLSNWRQKCIKFKTLMDELQKLPECGHLALQHHMLEPIQRVPRYEMLLKDYLKLLPEDSDDRANTEKALQVVTTAACHSNEAMKKIEKFRKVLDVHEKIGGSIPDLISPTRELVKEGKVTKVSRRRGALLERHLFLFNDILLVCCEQGMLIRPFYRVRDKLSVDGMKIYEGDNPDVKHTFNVKSKEKVLEFSCPSMEEKDEWQAMLWKVVQDFERRKLSLKPDDPQYDTGINDDKIGLEAPKWVRDDSASMCMVCEQEFKTFKRRHHCRACGIVVCQKCSDYKTKLQFDGKIHRVCKRCHDIIMSRDALFKAEGGVVEFNSPQQQKNKGILAVKADDPSVMSGSLKISTDGGKTWNKRWFAVHTDFVLYSFKAKRDVAATNSTPLPGFQVMDVEEKDEISEVHVFKLCHSHIKYFFQAPTELGKVRWMDILARIVKAEIPTIYHPEPDPNDDEDGGDADD